MKLKLKDYSIIFILLFTIISSSYGQYKVFGKITDNEGKAISNVEVYVDENGKTTISNNIGEYEITNLSKGKHKLLFFSFNYEISERIINLNQTSTKLNITLDRLDEQLSEVLINQRKRKIFSMKSLKPVEGTAIYAGKKTEVVLIGETVGNRAANNARQIYSQVVGLNIYENDDAGLQLNIGGRGLDPNRTSNFNTRQNGYDISADVLGYPESYYTPPADALEEIQVIRGAASLQYGTQFGGLLNFKFNKPNKHKEFELITRQSIGSYGLFNSFNSVSGTINKTGYYGYANYKRGDGFRPNSNFESINIYAHAEHHFTNKTSLTLEATYLNYLAKQAGGLTDTMFKEDPLQSNRDRNWFRVNWNLWALKFKHSFTEDSKMSINLFGLDASRKALGYRTVPITSPDVFENGQYVYNRDLISGAYKNWGAEARFLSKYDIGNQSNPFLIGFKYYQANNSEQQGAGADGVEADFTFKDNEYPTYDNKSNFKFPNLNLALFGEQIFNITDNFSITPGFRFEYIKTEGNGTYRTILRDGAGNPLPGGIFNYEDNREKERKFVLLGVGLSYKPIKGVELYANASQNYRSVTFNDIRTVSPTFVVDENIDDEKGGTADIGVRGKLKNFIIYDISGFALFYNQRIGVFWVTEGPNKGDRLRTNTGDAFIYGLESFMDVNLANAFNIPSKNYILNSFVNLAVTESEYTKSKEKSALGNQVEFIPQINLKTGLKFGYKNFLGSLQYTYLSKQYTDATHAEVDASHPSYGTIGPIPAYSIMDASFSYSYKKWKFETGVNNLLNESYFTRRATGYPGPGIIPSSPRSYYFTLQFKI